MTRRDAMILGIITIIGSAFMFSYLSGFNPTFILWSVGVSVLTIGLFLFAAYKRGIFSNPNKK
ncbi:hypothetical protein [Clostridium cylindrosporum]|uniref:Uncharacterized protein n=1 Tax=Clostridium cylindrosporum DSM 605 TaxID=1121307 RepID=A0A0J8D721_CLOCY|nr:hypothetical protein [Clostridium cylindrosporum]KMT21865.1 hypothetical protein CLCY_3c01360 [Clostridium cylindrosporum DSM 605]